MEKTVHRPGTPVVCVRSHRAAGFTLLELSIVLVIIGLLMGAIVVGNDMIHAAETHSFIRQLTSFNTAVNVFRQRYNYLPGDIPAPAAAQFGMTTRSGNTGHGDGDGMIKGGSVGSFTGADGATCGEVNLFWADLSTANLVGGHYTGTDSGNAVADCNISNPSTAFPTIETGSGPVTLMVYGDPSTGSNFYQIAADCGSNDTAGGCNAVKYPVLTPMQAYVIDSKIDDGNPSGGKVQAINGAIVSNAIPTVPVTPAAPASGVCVSNATGNPYNIGSSTGGNVAACSIRIPVGG